jgi:hypothetical protein
MQKQLCLEPKGDISPLLTVHLVGNAVAFLSAAIQLSGFYDCYFPFAAFSVIQKNFLFD